VNVSGKKDSAKSEHHTCSTLASTYNSVTGLMNKLYMHTRVEEALEREQTCQGAREISNSPSKADKAFIPIFTNIVL